MMPSPEQKPWYSTYEKVYLTVQLSQQLQGIHAGMEWLSKYRFPLPRRRRHQIQLAIEENCEDLLMRLMVLAERRKCNMDVLIGEIPKLPKSPSYEDWRTYILPAVAAAEKAMDQMDLSVTGIPYDDMWEEPFIGEVLNFEGTFVGGEDEDEDEDDFPEPLIPILPEDGDESG